MEALLDVLVSEGSLQWHRYRRGNFRLQPHAEACPRVYGQQRLHVSLRPHLQTPAPRAGASHMTRQVSRLRCNRHGCFYKLGVLLLVVLIERALLCRVCTWAPDFWTFPHANHQVSLAGSLGFRGSASPRCPKSYLTTKAYDKALYRNYR